MRKQNVKLICLISHTFQRMWRWSFLDSGRALMHLSLIIILTTPLHVPHTCHATPPPLQETSVSEKDWFSILKQTLKTLYSIDYEKVTSQTLWGIRCLILVKSEHSNKISHVQVHSMGQLCLQFCMLLFSQIVGFTICSVMYEIILLLDNNSIIIHIHGYHLW